jgi:uncharacterized protein
VTLPEPLDVGDPDTVPRPEDPDTATVTPDTATVTADPDVTVDGTAAPDGTGSETPVPSDGAADFRMAVVSSVTLDLPSQHPQVCLRELESPRRQLTFSVGMPDAVALAHAQRRIPTPRPLTHEVMGEVLQRFDIDIVAVRIVGRLGAVHFAELDLRGRSGRSVHSCRPTDALILALHQPVQVPILIDVRLLEGAGDIPPPGTA